ncbi:hypothetical protein BB559_003920 [Furculomyces boomerangus]|uniref:CSC1/OSCA1-like 7TM region domain-containing protein n=1 Tax=Furculomyces boomerangus TaxID=61424 RepID=A0A2T9YI08_9FUNG|nr:hypothetical protein BB559_003920 [Furculomyces boomerangus]
MSAEPQKAVTAKSVTIDGFWYALVLNLIIGVSLVVAFCILRPMIKRVYSPRTYAIEEKKRVPPLRRNPFSWILPTLKTTDAEILLKTNLDSYMILRIIRFKMFFFAISTVLSLSILLPISITGTENNYDLMRLSAANINQGSNLFWIYLVYYTLSILLILFILFRECRNYVVLRQNSLIQSRYIEPQKAHTILVCGLRGKLSDEKHLNDIFSILPGNVKNITVNRDASELDTLVKKRDCIIQKLEVCLTNYVVDCKEHFSELSKQKGFFSKLFRSNQTITTIKPPELPTHRKFNFRKSLAFVSTEKVNTLLYFSEKLVKYNKLIREFQSTKVSTLKKKQSAFVTFTEQIAAHLAVQSIVNHQLLTVTPKLLDTDPSDVIWKNLDIRPYDRRIRNYISILITAFIVITWGSLSVLLTSLVNFDSIAKALDINTEKISFLRNINGFIAPLLIATLVSVLPYFLRFLLDLEGKLRYSDIEFEVCRRYYMFLAFTVFILPQIAASITGLLEILSELYDSPSLILPKINQILLLSNPFFITFVILKAFSVTSSYLVMVPSLFTRCVLPWIYAISPRQRYISEKPSTYDWATMIPQHFLIFLIGTTYAAIAPLINIFCFIYFLLIYVIYHYQFMYVFDDSTFSLGGSSFLCSIKQAFSSLYMVEIIWLLMMLANIKVNKSAIARVVLSLLVILITYTVDKNINKRMNPLFKYLPLSLAKSKYRTSKKLPLLQKLNSDFLTEYNLNSDSDEDISDTDSINTEDSVSLSESQLPSQKSQEENINYLYSGYTGVQPQSTSAVGSINLIDTSLLTETENSPTPAQNHPKISNVRDVHLDPKVSSKTYDKGNEKILYSPRLLPELEQKSFSHPALSADSYSLLWMPDDETGLCKEIITSLNNVGKGYFSIFTKGAYINKRNRVSIDFDFNFNEHLLGIETLAHEQQDENTKE